MIEATGIANVIGVKTLIQIFHWYFSDIKRNYSDQHILESLSHKNKMLQLSIGSANRTVRIIGLIIQIVAHID